MQSAFTLNKLSMDFYNVYNSVQYPEIEYKPSRPYVVMIFTIHGNKFALPFRTNIRHDYCYKFKNTERETDSVTGIDFTKAVIVNDSKYIGATTTIDNKEYVELMNKFYFVIKKFRQYLEGYIEYKNNGGNEFVARKYQYTTLKYFDKELGLQDK